MGNSFECKHKNWPIEAERYVAFLDIMGFKDMVLRKSHKEIYSMLMLISEKLKIINECKKNYIYIVQFSDSVILISKDNSEKSKHQFIYVLQLIFTSAFDNYIPMKGAVAYGVTTFDVENSIYFGQSLIDAYLLQEELYYYGVVFHNSAEKNLENRNDVFKAKTFFKTGNITHCNLAYFTELTFNSIDKYIDDTLNKMMLSVSGTPRKYIDNTREMYNRFKEYYNGKK